MEESTYILNNQPIRINHRRPPWFVEVIGLFGILFCAIGGVIITLHPFEEPAQPAKPFNVPNRGMAIWLGAGAVMGLAVGVGAYWLILRACGYHRRPVHLAARTERQELTSEERLARARRRQSEEALWQISSPPPSNYQYEHNQRVTGTGPDKKRDAPFAVVIPRHDCTPEELREIGSCLRQWMQARPYARQVLGLEDLEAGQQPSSPGYYMFPFNERFNIDELRQRYPHDDWRAALMIVAGGLEVAVISRELDADLASICDRLARYGDPVSFDPMFL